MKWSMFQQYSHPSLPHSEALFSVVAESCANHAVASAVKRARSVSCAEYLCAALESWICREKSLKESWSAQISKIGRHASDLEPERFRELFSRLLIAMAHQLPDFELDYTAATSLPLRAGPWLTVPGGNTHFAKRGSCHTLVSSAGRYAWTADGSLILNDGANLQRLNDVKGIYITETSQDVEELTEDSPFGIALSWPAIGDYRRYETMVNAVALLEQIAPQYVSWIVRALTDVVLSPQLSGRTNSGSRTDLSGIVSMSQPTSIVEAAELLVHEASHQYLNMARNVGAVKIEGFDKEYYSPPVGKNRTLDKILIAYHAFANVVIIYSLSSSHACWTEGDAGRFRYFSDVVRVLDSHLQEADGLSELGKAIYFPLKDAVEGHLLSA